MGLLQRFMMAMRGSDNARDTKRSTDTAGAAACDLATHGGLPGPAVDEAVAGAGGEQAEASLVLAGGCFWCVEAVFEPLDGVQEVVSGYAGGDRSTADYHSVCTGETGHAEAIRVTYDRSRITLGRLMQVFFGIAHDPTQKDRQGPDRGPQYRSALFYADEEQRRIAEDYIKQLDQAGVFGSPIVTRLEPLEGFYEAEGYHQDFVANHPNQPYARLQAKPKLAKLREQYGDMLRGTG